MCGRYDNLIAGGAYRGRYKAMQLQKSNFPPQGHDFREGDASFNETEHAVELVYRRDENSN